MQPDPSQANPPADMAQSSSPHGDAQRRALEQSERKANEERPEDYKDDETADKVVEIGPDMTRAPIKGIDPEAPQR